MKARAKTTGMAELKADLRKAQRQAPSEGQRILKRGAQNIKKDAQDKIRGVAHAPDYPRSISYDVVWRRDSGHAEIGPDKDKKQGALGNILEYGTINNAPLAHLGPALDYEQPEFEEQIERMGRELLE